VADVPDPDRPETWVFQLMPSWTGPYNPDQTDAERLAFLKDKAQYFAEPWKSAFLWIPDGTPFPCSNMTHWVTIPWDNRKGMVTLAGDAAHAMPPHT
jgi:2-polyprenyl-6-methoxyphenol hydroxylase-like FAD-dependent oxidoreductase